MYVWGGRELYTGCWWGNLRERNNLEDPGVNERIILRWVFRNWDVRAWTGSSWLRVGTGGGHLWMRWWNFGFYKMRGICWLAENRFFFTTIVRPEQHSALKILIHILPSKLIVLIMNRNFIIHYFKFCCKRNGIPLSATLLYLNNWPEDDRLRSKHVATMWPNCIYCITVLIYYCILRVCNTSHELENG